MIEPRPPKERGRWPLRLAIAAVPLFVVGPALANLSLVPPIAGFGLYVLGGFLALLGTIAGVVTTFRGERSRGRRAIAIGVLPAALFVYTAAGARDDPPINDITTDLADPPAFAHAATLPSNSGRDFSYPAAFVEVVRSAYPDLEPLRLSEPPERVFDRALLVARGTRSWQVTNVDRENLTFEGVATSKLFRFRDDFVVRVRSEGGQTKVDMRSKSRDGRGDLGANAERIRDFLGRLTAAG